MWNNFSIYEHQSQVTLRIGRLVEKIKGKIDRANANDKNYSFLVRMIQTFHFHMGICSSLESEAYRTNLDVVD
ncbi:hypothetical protein PR048_013952 [Dryococelus australis]|uniref:Uncharacterized protein n=1 Tax=Dryococelus australis TaxID=614101 RepID=A0ABQ9HTN6_9NEOP|nr:hypothetical protein PR048_013952 [Dryococelus australis]